MQRRGYESLEAARSSARAEGELEAKRAAIVAVLESRGLALDDAGLALVETCSDPGLLTLWLRRAAVAVATDGLLEPA